RPVAVARPRREPDTPLAVRRTDARPPAGRLRGRPPYGYQVVVLHCPDGPVHVLEPDGRTAPVVRRIFSDYLAGHGLQRIAEGLTADTVPCPSAHDRSRNPHHGGFAWSKGAVRAILVNPRYTGLSKWDAVDPGDAPPEPAYEPLVQPSIFRQVQQEFAAKRHARSANPERGLRAYVFRGLLRCGICNRLMQGAWNNDESYYRCRIPEEYATANRISHPRNVYLRERRLQPALDGWLTATCAPARLVQLVRAGRHPLGEADAGLTAALSRSVRGLREAGPSERADTYAALKLRLVYYPPQQLVRAKIALGPREVAVRGLIDLKRTAGPDLAPAPTGAE
ncbi:MAG TPA: recombinase family protein, partial [Mycobacteriales bacterium]|nr:recombinase family protein [Mycobacteriales bacterium]